MRILITGGAGFVGCYLAKAFQDRLSSSEIVVFDNLKRRGAEMNLSDLEIRGIKYIHGDIRSPFDLADIDETFDLLIEASAEPSVLAGMNGSPNYVLQTNLAGAMNCFEFARKKAGRVLFLSSSRVYSIAPLKEIRLSETDSRFEINENQSMPGVSPKGIAENFPVSLPRSLYGASKYAAEVILQEYADTYKLPAIINRCGVIAGPGQFGKVDQGIFSLWVMHHLFNRPLRYTGFGGKGKQVRDLLHPADLFDLIVRQMNNAKAWDGSVFNAGGGTDVSVSMQELTSICRDMTGHTVAVTENPETSPVDIPLYITDYSKAFHAFGWVPGIKVDQIVSEIKDWIVKNGQYLETILK